MHYCYHREMLPPIASYYIEHCQLKTSILLRVICITRADIRHEFTHSMNNGFKEVLRKSVLSLSLSVAKYTTIMERVNTFHRISVLGLHSMVLCYCDEFRFSLRIRSKLSLWLDLHADWKWCNVCVCGTIEKGLHTDRCVSSEKFAC